MPIAFGRTYLTFARNIFFLIQAYTLSIFFIFFYFLEFNNQVFPSVNWWTAATHVVPRSPTGPCRKERGSYGIEISLRIILALGFHNRLSPFIASQCSLKHKVTESSRRRLQFLFRKNIFLNFNRTYSLSVLVYVSDSAYFSYLFTVYLLLLLRSTCF